jgi:hypothetical protein
MNLIDRAKNILMSPKTEWLVVDTETATPGSLLRSYVIPMALIGAIAAFIGYGFIGLNIFGVKIAGINWGIAQGLTIFVSAIVSYFISTYVIDALAPSFGSEKNINKSAQLVAYASTAAWVAGIFHILPSLAILGILGLYSVYLFYVGLPIMKKTPEDKKIVYMIVSALVIIVVGFVIQMILMKIVYAVMGNPYAGGFDNIYNR